ncbi:MAG: radical SAM protein [Candidatus Omnitrophota bacterium]|nr:radical SAM protein [Candidatus Omnitrophota bacterium]
MSYEQRLTVGSLGKQEIDPGTPKVGKWVTMPQAITSPHRRKFNRVFLLNPAATLFKNDYPRCTYPLGIGYIAAVLENHEYTVKILDVFAEGYNDGIPIDAEGNFISYGLHDEGVIEAIREFNPDVVGVSSIFSNQADNVQNLLKLAKQAKPGVVTAIGGAHARYFPKACLSDPNLDVVFLGESELTFLQYLEHLNGNYDVEKIGSIAFRQGDEIKINSENVLISSRSKNDLNNWSELDQIPFPAWHLYDMEKYFDYRAYQSPYTKGDRVAQIYTSRGCSAHCTFCTTTNFWGNKLRRRSPENVVEEIIALKEQYGINEFHVQDDNITNDMKHAKILFRSFREIGLPWQTPQGTALWRMDEELLDLMVASGAYQLTFAIESGVQRVLDQLIKKPLDLEKTKHLIKYARQIGLHVHGYFIIGMPPMFGHEGETLEEMATTYRFAQECEFSSASFFAAVPIVGSELLTECVRQGFIDPSVNLFRMSYKQGLIDVPGLWRGTEIAELAAKYNYEFNKNDTRAYTEKKWSALKY